MKRNWRDGEEYGSARWSTSREMAPYTDNDTRQNLQMTATEGLSLDAQATRRNLNTTVIGGSGSGKTATHVIPNILKGSMNYACTDPKGELYAKTGGDLEKMGYTVKQLDLVDLTSETKFNPMRYIDPTKPDVAIMRLVTNIMDNTNGSTPKEHQTDDFWTKSERSLLTALTAFVYYLPDDILKDCLHISTRSPTCATCSKPANRTRPRKARSTPSPGPPLKYTRRPAPNGNARTRTTTTRTCARHGVSPRA